MDINNDFFVVKFDLEANKVKVMKTTSWCKPGPSNLFHQRQRLKEPWCRSAFQIWI